MTPRSLQRTEHLSKQSERLQTHSSCTPVLLPDNQPCQERQALAKLIQARRDLMQTYYLERRCFL